MVVLPADGGNLVSMASLPPASFNDRDKALPWRFVRGIML
jgi:hypothetical protein